MTQQTNIVRKGKINRHEKIAQVLLTGLPVSPEEIIKVFTGTNQEKVLYRLSTNIYNIRKDGGIVKVIKSGRKVTGYQLVNVKDFDTNGRFIGQTCPVVTKANGIVKPEVKVHEMV